MNLIARQVSSNISSTNTTITTTTTSAQTIQNDVLFKTIGISLAISSGKYY